MKQPAIISTLLDRQAGLLDAVLREQPMDIIAPRLFAETARQLGKKHQVKVHIIEEAVSSYDQLTATKELAASYNAKLEASHEPLENWLEQQGQKASLAPRILKVAEGRTEKLLTLYRGLDLLHQELDIQALLVNQEYMIHEATLVNWAKHRDVPSVHFCHCPYTFRSVGSMRHFVSSHMTLTSERCNLTLDDMQTGHGERQVTGLINWDAYRDIGFEHLIQINEQLAIPDDALVISFFTSYAFRESACADPETYEKSLDAFLQAAAEVQAATDEELFFIVKDRPSGIAFGEEQVKHKAKKFGLEKNLAYLFIRPEVVVARSDITISCGSGIALEGMALGKPTIELVIRQTFLANLVFAADDGVIQCEPPTLAAELLRLVEDEDLREDIADIVIDKDDLIEPTQLQQATQESAAYLLEILGKEDAAEKVRSADDFYDHLQVMGQDARFQQTNAFQVWRARTQPNELTGQLMGERYNQWQHKPSFHLVVVADKSLFDALANTLDSFELQIYPHYGVSIISPDACPDESLLSSPNLQWVQSEKPFEAINEVISQVEADWVMQLWPGDELQPQALFNLADYANINSDWLAIYGDEVLIKPTTDDLADDESRLGTSEHTDPIFKPDFNLDLLRSTDYVNRATAFRKDAWTAMEGFRALAYRQTEDLVFRIAERMTLPAIGHLPNILVHRSTFMDNLVASDEHEALGALIRQEHLVRCQFEKAQVQPGLHPQIYNTRYQITDSQPVTDLLIATSGLNDSLRGCLVSLKEQLSADTLQIYVSVPSKAEAQAWLLEEGLDFTQINWVEQADFSANLALQWKRLIEASQADYFILAFDRVRWVQSNWLHSLLDQLQRPDVAMTGPRLVSSRATIISAGQILGKDGLVGDLYRDFFLEQEVPGLPRAWCEQNFNALNPSCIAIKRSAYEQQGGLDEAMVSHLAVNDLQLKLCTQGQKLVWTPLSTVVVTDPLLPPPDKDVEAFKGRWFNLLPQDPAFNPNLELRGSGVFPDILLSGRWHLYHHQRPQLLAAFLDQQTEQVESAASIIKGLHEADKNEIIQLQEHHYLSSNPVQPINTVELARLMPDTCVYIGSPTDHEALLKDTPTYTQIEQWAVITSSMDWEAWQPLEEHLTGWLFTDAGVEAKCTTKKPSKVIKSLADSENWLQDTFSK
ncbi:Glycosyltransferase involved in cell wall bisynthesis [Marinospirillum celere]|uniref:Glycosyltransferase involved in cell wall bisynthesis n=1 Tax=Marinospirillum celere TaxID=1122252 RepID=A0A1I1GS51_9GAMM|nr:hypothetical protein [Marinospirillum celere]SFC14295.1 Glycosyltransferase involved in cell wall bisynthesis [Marinospirillum celere]